MGRNASDFLLDRLHEWGVYRIYGYPGDGINGILGALNRARNTIEFVQTRHEEMAAFMACAHAKFTGELGVCLATSGPGAIHLLNGLYDAKKDHQPVLAIVGQQPTFAIGGDFQQEVDLISLFKDVAHHYVQMVTTPAQLRHVVDQAARIAIAERDVTCIIIPNDVQELHAQTSPPRKHGATYSGVGYLEPRIVPESLDLQHAADVLNAGERVAILVGAGALHARTEVIEAAQRLGAGVAKALLGKAVLPDDVPYCTGPIGLLGTRPSWNMMMNCDTFLMIGSSFPYSEFLPKQGQARGVQIDIKPQMLNLRYPMEVPLRGDSKLTLQALLPLLEYKRDRSWREEIEDDVCDWWQLLEIRAFADANPINPQRVYWELSPRLPDNCIITADSGSSTNWFARDLKIRNGMMASLSGGLATMLPAVPYALAAKLAYPDRPVIACVGDGAMQMLGNNELVTMTRYWADWPDPRLVIVVLNNEDLNQVTWEQRVMAGDPKFPCSQDLPPFDFARYASQLGFLGLRVDNPDDIGPAFDEAFNADRPALIDAIVDPDVPPIPPHITFEQARNYLSSIVQGDPDALGIISQSYKQVAPSWLPGPIRRMLGTRHANVESSMIR